jgi:peptidoglycan/xylan/chitin deacetylase (PgdA/CDA1 family)
MLRTAAVIALAALLCLAAACGDDDDVPDTSDSPTATPARTSPGASASPSTSPTTTATAAPTQPGETPTPPPAPATYTVQPGDTLYSIAQRFGTTVEAIAAANGIADPGSISVGQVLLIPGGGGPTPPLTTVPTQPPGSGDPAVLIRVGNTSRNTVAFTFDAGSDAGYTSMILDTLRDNGITASFGMTGNWANTYPDLLRRIVNEGHTLINHSYTHKSFTGDSTGAAPLTQAERWDEIDRTEAAIQALTGATSKPYFRPPYGDFDQSVNEDVGAHGYAYNIMWTVDSRGWLGISAPEITQRCLEMATAGAIYVFHVGAASQDGPALQSLIDGLRADGYAIGDINSVLAP